jgi:nucleotide-binding universal stress UspA family protein
MFKSIVVGTDGSETADIALRRAVELARLTGARLHVVSAYEPAAAHVGGNKPVAEAGQWTIGPEFKVDAVLERATGDARLAGVEFEVHAPRGDAAAALVDAAKEHDADVIVLGNRGCRERGGCSAASRTRSRTGRPATC